MFEGLHFKPLTLPPSEKLSERALSLANIVSDVKGSLVKAVSGFRDNCIRVGFLLKQLKSSGCYRVASRYSATANFTYGDPFLKEPFLLFCKDQFGLCKTTVYALIQVAERFGDSDGKPISKYEDYEYSQLLEMSSMSDASLKLVSSNMPVLKIRAIKKEQEKAIVPEEPEKINIVAENPYLFKDVKNARDEFKLGVKRFFEKGNYKVMVNGSFIGGQAFGAELFDYLLKRGLFNANKKP